VRGGEGMIMMRMMMMMMIMMLLIINIILSYKNSVWPERHRCTSIDPKASHPRKWPAIGRNKTLSR
jgi:hypothetical protein